MLKANNLKTYALLFLILLNVFIFYSLFLKSDTQKIKVIFLDVGQGDAIFIESPTGNQFLIDGGPDTAILKSLGRVMPFFDRSIDAILVTHPDQDHIGGLPEVIKNYSVKKYFSNGATSSTGTSKELQDLIKKNNIENFTVEEGEVIDLGEGVLIKILYPNKENLSGQDTNDSSVIVKLYYGNTSFLLTGDAPTKVEQYLAFIKTSEIDSDVLKVAHHGSKNSLSPDFFSAVSPEYSIISAGKNNRYGHPDKEIIDALNGMKTKILETFVVGDIIFVSDGENLELK